VLSETIAAKHDAMRVVWQQLWPPGDTGVVVFENTSDDDDDDDDSDSRFLRALEIDV